MFPHCLDFYDAQGFWSSFSSPLKEDDGWSYKLPTANINKTLKYTVKNNR